ncbi:MAG: diacylglycerol kinase family lipid kinase [Nocardiopsaceae bacterium]|nr:diacylglycerol kinase family lipid kinase [Nocardiopsaceae bacterium]
MPAAVFVINHTLPRARGHLPALCRAAAIRVGWEPEIVPTDKADAGVTAAREAAASGAGVVIAVGGDGTVRGCAEALAGTSVPLGIVPLGTGNLLARTLGIPPYPRVALDIALGPGAVTRRIDLATADGEPFTAMAGIGLDAAVVASTRLKHRLGWFAYAVSGATHLADSPARFTIRLDGGTPLERLARSVVAGNSGLLPGGFALLPDARPDDGLLDIGILAPRGPLGWPRLATRVLTNRDVTDRQLERLQARTVEITTDAPLPREVDGEVIAPSRTLTVTVRPAALTVRVPG